MELLLVVISIVFVLFVTLVLFTMRHVLNRMDALHEEVAGMRSELDRVDVRAAGENPSSQFEDAEEGASGQSLRWDV